jgi:multidrug efflux pump subunit AcrB
VITVGAVTELFDASLKQVGTVPELNGMNGGAWLDDNTLYYASAGQLCAYDVSKSLLSLAATMPDNDQIQAISVSADGSYVYATASSSTDTTPSAVFRIGLRGQSVSSGLSTLADVLPINGSTYSIGIRNFSGKPTIDVTAFPGTDPNDALQAAQDAVQGIVNLSDVNFDVQSGD